MTPEMNQYCWKSKNTRFTFQYVWMTLIIAWTFVLTGEAPTEQLGKQIGMDLTPLEPELIDTMIGEEEAVETSEI